MTNEGGTAAGQPGDTAPPSQVSNNTGGSVAGTEVSGLTGATGTNSQSNTGTNNSGTGRGSRRGGNRHHNRGGRGPNNRSAGSRTVASTFKGRQEGLEDYVYDLITPTAAAGSYATTTERIAEFIGTEWSGAGLIRDEIITMKEQEYPEPAEPDANLSAWKKKLAETEGNEWVKDMRKLKARRQQAIALVWGQCSDSVRSKIENTTEYRDACNNVDLIKILQIIQAVMYQFQADKKQSLSVLESKLRLYKYRQGPDQSLADYYKMFKRYLDVAEHTGGSIGYEKGLVASILKSQGIDYERASADEMSAAVFKARDEMLAIMFIYNADQNRYKSFMADLQNQFSVNPDVYPPTLDAT